MNNNFNKAVDTYVNAIASKFSHIETSEIGYRTDFELLLKEIFESIKVKRIDHDAKAKEGNKPDFVIIKDVPILYIETKDIGISLDKVEKSEQMSRYYGYDNLVLTDYLEFRFYRNGLPYGTPIIIGSYNKNTRAITTNREQYEYLARTFLDFAQSHKEPIKSGAHLAKIMGGKAQRIRDNVRFLMEGSTKTDQDLTKLYDAIKEMLVKDLTPHSFADMYAQTLVYGLFVARYNDKTPDSFSRAEARELISNSNKFLQRFFDHIAGVEFKSSLKYIVDELCEVYSHSDITKLMENYYNKSKDNPKYYDPIIHFYEDFLKEYDPELKKKMGAYYTPQPIVDFIVKSVDHLLKEEFNLPGGLSDTTKLPSGLHKVQILDPATGTGTFISTIIREIYKPFKQNKQEGRWPAYVHNDLLPRIHAFELMIAPYTIAHLRLGIAFRKTGFWNFHRRLGIYLTNSLENDQKHQLAMSFGLAESIAEESKEAAIIKNKTPVMVVVGNPPYSGISSNETKYANSLVDRYKVEPGGRQKLQERKHWLNDDYVKFIGLAESMIEKTGSGIIAMITNNGYLDNPTFRGMRWQLANTFDKIYVLDLHGNTKKREKAPDGNKDENVFDIMQGVGVILAIKNKAVKGKNLAKVYHAEVYGKRPHKFEQLSKTPKWQEIVLDQKMMYFVPKSIQGAEEYNRGVSVDELFVISSVAAASACDDINFAFRKSELIERMNFISNNDEASIRNKFGLKRKDSRDWKMSTAKLDVASNFSDESVYKSIYRPFDFRYTFYSGNSRGIYASPQKKVIQQIINGSIGLGYNRKIEQKRDFADVFVYDKLMQYHSLSIKETNSIAPLYIYTKNGERTSNLSQSAVNKLMHNLNAKPTPEDIFDYVYATLYSPSYRQKYQEFLKDNYPKIVIPKSENIFKKLVKLGKELRELHLLESLKLNKFITTYPVAGSDSIEKLPVFIDEKVYINDRQYFGSVPEISWNFYIGSYQPAQKWLKDRKGRKLSNEDIEHYQKIIVALVETDRIMKEVDNIIKY